MLDFIESESTFQILLLKKVRGIYIYIYIYISIYMCFCFFPFVLFFQWKRTSMVERQFLQKPGKLLSLTPHSSTLLLCPCLFKFRFDPRVNLHFSSNKEITSSRYNITLYTLVPSANLIRIHLFMLRFLQFDIK